MRVEHLRFESIPSETTRLCAMAVGSVRWQSIPSGITTTNPTESVLPP